MIFTAFRHGRRAIEPVNLKWEAVDFTGGRVGFSATAATLGLEAQGGCASPITLNTHTIE
jgi:hypothetical protein